MRWMASGLPRLARVLLVLPLLQQLTKLKQQQTNSIPSTFPLICPSASMLSGVAMEHPSPSREVKVYLGETAIQSPSLPYRLFCRTNCSSHSSSSNFFASCFGRSMSTGTMPYSLCLCSSYLSGPRRSTGSSRCSDCAKRSARRYSFGSTGARHGRPS